MGKRSRFVAYRTGVGTATLRFAPAILESLAQAYAEVFASPP